MAPIAFDEKKFRNVVLYLLQNAPGKPGVTQLLKMLYFSDWKHYRAHLAPITGAQYVAIERGPVVDNYKQIFAELVRQNILQEAQVPILGLANPKTEYVPLFEPDLGIFTSSEIQVLDEVIKECGRASGDALSDKSHQEGPWTFAWNANNPGQKIPYTLFRWLDNWPDERDEERAKASVARPEVVAVIRQLQSA